MSGAAYPLEGLLELRARERDEALKEVSRALEVHERCIEGLARAEREREAACAALAAFRPLPGDALVAAELQSRARHRDQLRARRDVAEAGLRDARERVCAAEADVERARDDLAQARAAHRAVELHRSAHLSEVRAVAEARVEEERDEVAQTLARRRGRRQN